MDFEGKEGLLFRNQATKTGLIFRPGWPSVWSLGNANANLYNAVANNGVLVKPQFVSEIKEWKNHC
jgi:hypothetical protein